MKALIERLKAGIDLNAGDIGVAVALLLSDTTEDSMKADFLTALHRKGESVEEIVCFVQQLISRAVDPLIDPKNLAGPMIDVCGTGGDGLDLFNVSTTIMFVLAASGVERGVTRAGDSASQRDRAVAGEGDHSTPRHSRP